MPTYEYECQRCGHRFDRFQRITDDPLKQCPKCRGKVRRLVGKGAGIIFKGSGFYQTDYRSSSYREAAKKEKGEGGGGGESKPKETKSETAKPSGSGAKSSSQEK
jgi:putative FmdB family regulatory protein